MGGKPGEDTHVQFSSKSETRSGTWATCTGSNLKAFELKALAREGASGFRTKRVDVFDAALVRSLQTGQHFEKREPSPSDVDVGFDALASEATLS